MKKFSFLIILLITLSCKSNKPDISDLIKVDRQFSLLSETKGVNIAFMDYAHDSAVLLRKNSYPIIGKHALKNIFNRNDSAYTLTWNPSYAFISESNDLGYTYGIYTLKLSDTLTYGTYVSVWKNTNKGWKYILDCGNDGLQKK